MKEPSIETQEKRKRRKVREEAWSSRIHEIRVATNNDPIAVAGAMFFEALLSVAEKNPELFYDLTEKK